MQSLTTAACLSMLAAATVLAIAATGAVMPTSTEVQMNAIVATSTTTEDSSRDTDGRANQRITDSGNSSSSSSSIDERQSTITLSTT